MLSKSDYTGGGVLPLKECVYSHTKKQNTGLGIKAHKKAVPTLRCYILRVLQSLVLSEAKGHTVRKNAESPSAHIAVVQSFWEGVQFSLDFLQSTKESTLRSVHILLKMVC